MTGGEGLAAQVGQQVRAAIEGSLAEAHALAYAAASQTDLAAGALRWIGQNTDRLAPSTVALAGASVHAQEAARAMELAADNLYNYLGAIGVGSGASPLGQPAYRESAAGEPERHEPSLRGLPVDPAETRQQYDRWESGETVQSTGENIGSTPTLTDEEEATVAATPKGQRRGYEEYNPEEITHGRNFTAEQAAIVRAKLDAFLERVNADRARSALSGLPTNVVISIGHYDPVNDPEVAFLNAWHVDQRRRAVVRYVQSAAGNSTEVLHGPLNKGDLVSQYRNDLAHPERIGYGPDKTWQPITHGPGAVTRFRSDYVFHKPPDTPGFRLFFSADVPVQPAPPAAS